MELKDFKSNKLEDSILESILGGTDIFGEDTGFIIEDESDFLVDDIIDEEGNF